MSTLDHPMATNFVVLRVENTFVHCINVGSAPTGRAENVVIGALCAREVITNMESAAPVIRPVIF